MTPDELRNKSESDLKIWVGESKEELFKLKLQHSTGQLEKTHRLSELKKNVARAMTVLRSKQ
ncbi:MAG: 50S ribosomal protein L29 [Deltaproteobacteria bacterium]|nr:50S ribosomal protein L29 [Deltaproteobacteria bacterium]